MAGEFLFPGYGLTNTSFAGAGTVQPAFQLPGYTPGSSLVPGASTQAADLARLAQLNQQMQPSSFLPFLNAGIQGVSTLGNLFLGWHGLRQAQEAAAWQKQMAERNYGNSVQSYNTAMEDRVRARYGPAAAARSQDAINAEIERRRIGGG